VLVSEQILYTKEHHMRVPFDTKPFRAPSGRVLGYADLCLIAGLADAGSIGWSEEEVPYHKGFRSHVYIQMRNELSRHPALLARVAARIKEGVEQTPLTTGPQRCVIGIPTAGTQLAQAVAMLSHFDHVTHVRPHSEPPICFQSMRSVLKETHGKDRHWIGPADIGRYSYVSVENVISTAAGMLEYLDKMWHERYPIRVMHHVVFADWELGGIKNLDDAAIKHVHTLYVVRDMVAALVYLGAWPQERYEDVAQRLQAAA